MSSIKITSEGDGPVSVVVDGVEMNEACGLPIILDRYEVIIKLPSVTSAVEFDGEVTLDAATVRALHALGWSHPDVKTVKRQRAFQTEAQAQTIVLPR